MPRFSPTIVHMANATELRRPRPRKVAIFLWGVCFGWLTLILFAYLTKG